MAESSRPYVLRDIYLVPVRVSPFSSCATWGRFDIPGVLVSGSGLSASACSHACGRFRESPSVLVLAFHSSLFLVEGSSDGSATGDRSSPLDVCVYSLRFRLSSVASALSLLGSWAFLPPLSVSLLSDTVAPFLEETVRSSRRFYVFQSSTWWSSVGLSSYTFLGVLARVWSGFSLSRVGLHRSGRLLASGSSGLVAALPVHSGCALRRSLAVGRAVVSLHLFPPVVRGTLVLTGRSRHCRITAGLASMDMPLLVSSVESQLWGFCSLVLPRQLVGSGGPPPASPIALLLAV